MMPVRILVVDDEPGIVLLASAVLSQSGYEVLTATSPREALKIATDGARVDLILSDVMMPDMKGPELIAEVRQQVPSIAAVLMSGYASTGLPPDIPLVEKPFGAADLVSAIIRALPEKGSSSASPGQ